MRRIIQIWKIPELRQKILITCLLLAIYRIGANIPLPIVDQEQVYRSMTERAGGLAERVFGYVAMLSGINDLTNITIFGMGIMPYISASIIFQLLASVVPALEQLMKEGESGRRKINEYTRYATVGLTFFQSALWIRYMMSPEMGSIPDEYQTFWHGFMAVLIMTAGTVLLMWIGEQIDEFGIGNGISLIIMAGIVARLPRAIHEMITQSDLSLAPAPGRYGVDTVLVLVGLFFAVVLGVVAMSEAQRRIPIESAKHVRGRRVFGGTRHYLPLRVNQAGVMPIIFASSLLMFPYFLFAYLDRIWQPEWLGAGLISDLHHAFSREGFAYTVSYVALIYFFCYFWTAVVFNPKDIAENLQNYGSFIRGYRPGRRTADYLERVMTRITYVGSAFLALVAIAPMLISNALGVTPFIASFFGGTALLIVVSVALDVVQKIDTHLVLRDYEGLLQRG
jgi:preprotein translocase subunit SecY